MKATVPVIILVFAALQFVYVQADSQDAQESDVKLYEFKSLQEDWGFTLKNYGTSDINLKGYSVGNEKGSVVFKDDLFLVPDGKITVIKNDYDPSWSVFLSNNKDWLKHWGEDGIIEHDKFEVDDWGADILLKNGEGNIVDVFAYGEIGPVIYPEWEGRRFPQMKETDLSFAVRGNENECSANAWHFYGVTHVLFDPEVKYDADVTPFLFPDSGGIPVYRALENAKSSIIISMYSFNSGNLMGCLKECLERGVEVTILLEYRQDGMETGKLAALCDGRATIYIIFPHERYDSIHTKYCVIDDEVAVVTSENWTYSSFNGRTASDPERASAARGWGAVIKSADYAAYLKAMFQNDICTDYGDVYAFEDLYPHIEPSRIEYTSPTDEYPTVTCPAKITPFMSPDSSWDAIYHYISNAEKRVHAQQQVINDGYMLGDDSPLSWMISAAKSGAVDAKLLYCMKDEDVEDTLWFIEDMNENTNVRTGYMQIPYLHNKGIIADDIAILTSVNWTPYGMNTNREMGVVFHSKEIADFFEQAFERDFARNDRINGLTVTVDGLSPSMEKIDLYEITAVIAQAGTYSYEWTLDGKVLEWDTENAKFTADIGTHTLTLKVADAYEGSATYTLTFEITGFKVGTSALHALMIIGAVMLIAAALVYLLAIRRNKVSL